MFVSYCVCVSVCVCAGSTDGTVKMFQISGKRLLHTFKHSRPNQGALFAFKHTNIVFHM
jgi:hypothetical protein